MKRHSRATFAFLLVLMAFAFPACSRSAKSMPVLAGSFASKDEAPALQAAPGIQAAPELERRAPVASESSNSSSPNASSPNASSPTHGRKLVYTADMSIETKDPFLAEDRILGAVAKAGGYVASRSGDDYGIYLQIRLPVPALEPLMAEAGGTGKILSRSMSAQDVTDQYFDLEGRLRNKRILEERYRAYLKQAKTIEDMLEVERRLSETTNEIESLEGSFRDLSKQVDLATLGVSIRPLRAVDPSRPGFLQSLGNLFSSFGRVMGAALVAIIGILAYGIPGVLFLALLWFLAFGRIGLIRRLFRLVRAKKEKPAA